MIRHCWLRGRRHCWHRVGGHHVGPVTVAVQACPCGAIRHRTIAHPDPRSTR